MPSGAAVIRYAGKRGVVWRVKYADAEGKQVMETLGAERDGWTERKAEAELRERLVRVERKGWRKPAPLTFKSVIEEWFAATEVEKRWRPKTVKGYRTVVARLVETFGPMQIAAIRPRDVAAYKTAMLERYGASTVSRDLSLLHAFFAWAVVNERADRNPCVGVPHPAKPRWKGQTLGVEQVQAILRGFEDDQSRTAFLTVALTGIRCAELQELKWMDVDLIENRLRVVDSKTKTGERSIALAPSLAEELWQHLQRTRYRSPENRVFCHPERGTVYRPSVFKSALLAACKASAVTLPAGFRKFHDLRVTSITNGVRANEHPDKLQKRAGHANYSTTQKYIDLAGVVFPEEAAALADRLLGSSTGSSTDLASPEPTSDDPTSHQSAVSA